MNTDSFATSTDVRPLGDGTYVTELDPNWAVGDKPHGGYLLALLTQAATANTTSSPLTVSAQFLRAPKIGPVMLRTDVLKTGRTISVVRAVLEQSGQICVDATLNLGQLPDDEPIWSDLPAMPVNPPDDAIDLGSSEAEEHFGLSRVCDTRIDPKEAVFLNGDTGEPRLRMWVRPRNNRPDLLFSLIAGDITVPVTFNLGRFGWSPTVQLTALLRARPADGWLRLSVDSKSVHGPWFDEDTLVIDSTGKLVCQARQLALSATR